MATPPNSNMSPAEKAKAFDMAQLEMEYRVDLYNAMTASCFAKCMDTRYKEGDLNVGENSCVDRCAAKYWQVTGIVGQMLGGMQQQQQQPR
ncbi:subunit TIM10 of mitochondrial inner membrane translocase [Chloropicon roscoffensis]|uniref:Mitochondrial import inner membrane translocase subunit n=1 Tax=Chloropicon roscoffensis TaxID=1461544 RepID=A0AAX4P3M3_9CHLO